MARRDREHYVRPPLVAREPVGRVTVRRRLRALLVVLVVAILAALAAAVDLTAGGTQDNPGITGARATGAAPVAAAATGRPSASPALPPRSAPGSRTQRCRATSRRSLVLVTSC